MYWTNIPLNKAIFRTNQLVWVLTQIFTTKEITTNVLGSHIREAINGDIMATINFGEKVVIMDLSIIRKW